MTLVGRWVREDWWCAGVTGESHALVCMEVRVCSMYAGRWVVVCVHAACRWGVSV